MAKGWVTVLSSGHNYTSLFDPKAQLSPSMFSVTETLGINTCIYMLILGFQQKPYAPNTLGKVYRNPMSKKRLFLLLCTMKTVIKTICTNGSTQTYMRKKARGINMFYISVSEDLKVSQTFPRFLVVLLHEHNSRRVKHNTV